jgi:hypothetical protein
MKEGRHNGVNAKYFCDAFKLASCNATALHPGSSAKKKGDAFKHLPKNCRKKAENERQLPMHYSKNILRTSVDTLDGGATIHAPRHD